MSAEDALAAEAFGRDSRPAPAGRAMQERWSQSASRAAAQAYSAAYGREIADDATRVRWRLEPRVAATAAVVLALLGVWAWFIARAEPPLPSHLATSGSPVVAPSHDAAGGGGALGDAPAGPAEAAAPLDAVVHVSGAVASPGVVTVAPDARVADAIEAAGGAVPDAELAAVNLARVVRDGEQIHVPEVGEAPIAGPGPVDLNAADADALDVLPGIGPVLAARIVADREAHGPFASLDDLARVSGVGEAVVAGLADLAVA